MRGRAASSWSARGVGGLAAALALGRAGHRVIVLERDPLPDDRRRRGGVRRRAPRRPAGPPDPRLPRPPRRRAARALPRRPRRRCCAVGVHHHAGAATTSASRSPATRTSRCSSSGARPRVGAARGRRWPSRTSRCAPAPASAAAARPATAGRRGRHPVGRRRAPRRRHVARRRRRRRRHAAAAARCRGGCRHRRRRARDDPRERPDVPVTLVPRCPAALDVPLDAKLGGDLGYPEVPRRPRRRRHAVDHARHPHPRQRAARRAAAIPTASSRPAGCSPGPTVLPRRPARADRRRAPDGRAAQPGPPLRRRRRPADRARLPRRRRRAHVHEPALRAGVLAGARPGAAAGRRASPPTRTTRSAGAVAYEAACAREIEPWYHSSVQMDIAGADPGIEPGAAGREPASPMAAVFVAAATDPVHRPGADADMEPAGDAGRAGLADAEFSPGWRRSWPTPTRTRSRRATARRARAARRPARGSRPAVEPDRDPSARRHQRRRPARRRGGRRLPGHPRPRLPRAGYSWRHQLPALAGAGYRAVAPDQRGYGRSSRPDARRGLRHHPPHRRPRRRSSTTLGAGAGASSSATTGARWWSGHLALLPP